ncbi:MAG: CoA transferase [Rhodoferax sp.]|jgi:alpha-methylacyl-CoA racemase|nr:CoA transferase [Rhodoferax sp.]
MKPYAGLQVVEFATVGGVPFCGWWLAQQGAQVLRIANPQARELGVPVPADGDIGQWGRQSITLDIKSAQGQAEALRAIDTADVLLEGFRPGVMERLGLGPQLCHGRNPGLVYARLVGWDRDGAWAQHAGHDINYIAMTGALHALGAEQVPLNLVGDIGGGALYALAGVGAALFARSRNGRGCVVDTAMAAGSLHLMSAIWGRMAAGAWTDAPASNVIDGGVPWYRTYRTRDGRHMAVGAIEHRFYLNLLQGLDLDPAALEPREDPARWPALAAALAQRFATQDQYHWAQHFEKREACVTPVLSLHEARAHPVNQKSFGTREPGVHPVAVPVFEART